MKPVARLALALAWIAGLLLWLWPAARPRSAPPHAPAAVPGSASLARPDAAAPAREAEPGDPTRASPVADTHARRPSRIQRAVPSSADAKAEMATLRVRSSAGLPLLAVEGQIDDGEWVRADLLDGALEIEADSPAFRLRAAGHRELIVPAGAREVVLEPDALLEVSSPHLRNRVRLLDTYRDVRARLEGREFGSELDARSAGILAEFVDADRLLVAFSPERLAPILPGDVEVEFDCNDGPCVQLQIRAQPGLRAQWALPAAQARASAALDLALEDAGERPQYIHLRIEALDGVSSDTRQEFAWGWVRIRGGGLPQFPDPVWGRPARVRLEQLPLGLRCAVVGMDANGRFGRAEFVHDGSERTLVLDAPYTVTGRIVDAASGAPLPRSDVRCFPRGASTGTALCAREDGWDEEGGRFVLHLPSWDWSRAGSELPSGLPERFTLIASAKAHRSRTLEFAWEGRRAVDLGALALEPNPLALVIASDEITLAGSDDVASASFGDQPALEWAVEHLVSRGFGEHELEFAWADADARTLACSDLVRGERTVRRFERGAGEPGEVLLFAARGEPFAFQRAGESFRKLARRLHALRIRCDALPANGAWSLGWRGSGTWARFSGVRAVGPVLDELALPALASELWWSAGEAPPDLCARAGGTLALSSGAQTLVLR